MLAGYFIFLNLLGVFCMAVDKKRAIEHRWRISEKTLFLIAMLGGSAGIWAGMYLVHHKTRHWYFVLGIPAILFLQILCLWLLKR